jgi:RNA polymerase sigma-70 factor (ECF subfamily)
MQTLASQVAEPSRTTATDAGRYDRDRELVEGLRRRDADAAERLVTTYQGRAYRLAVGLTANPEDAEEVVQDACVNAIRKIDTFRGQSAFGSWFYRIVANAALQKTRRRRRRRIDVAWDDVLPAFDADGRHGPPVADWSAAIDDPARQTEIRLALRSAIEELPRHHRAALIMRDIENWSCAETAEVFRVSVGGVKTRLHRARLFIRKRLAESLLGRSLGATVEPRDQRGKRPWGVAARQQ